MKLEKTQVPQSSCAVALVTGSARRIGAAIVRALHEAGYRVVIHCNHSSDEAHVLSEQLNAIRSNSALVLQADLSEVVQCDSLIDAVLDWAGSLAVLVNNASLFMRSNLIVPDQDTYEKLYAVNVFAPWRLSLKGRPWLEKSEGCIINITDIHAEKPLKNYAEYCQTKAALWMQTQALAREFAPKIRVNAIAPGAISWPEADNHLSQQVKDQIIQETPLQRHGDPCHVADAVLALIQNDFITGQLLRVDGGRSLG